MAPSQRESVVQRQSCHCGHRCAQALPICRLQATAPRTHTPRPRWLGWLATLAVVALLWPSAALAQQPWEEAPLLEDTEPDTNANTNPDADKKDDDDGGVLVAEFGLDERNVVLSAAKTRTTIQEAPAIVSVITAEEIRSRGYRTVNDILQTIPGFEGDRWDFNGWTQESFARGNPRGLLVLLNGINIVEPSRNQITLDWKIPVSAIKRIEIVSGPGGVLWGSNALLGVVNIITRDADDLDGFEVIAGGGDGPGERQAARLALSYGGKWLDERLKLFTHMSIYTSNGPELEVDSQKIVGVLPAPADDGLMLFLPDAAVTASPSRSYYANWIGKLSFDSLTLEWMVPLEQDARQISSGGALLGKDYRQDTSEFAFDTETRADDKVMVLALQFKDRFASGAFGLSAKGYFVQWTLNEDPLGVFSPSDLSERTRVGVLTRIEDRGQFRYGLNLDMDIYLPADNRLIFGGEVFQDFIGEALTTSPVSDLLLDALNDEQRAQLTEENGVQLLTEPLINQGTRTIGALYVVDEFKANANLALSAGARLQLSDSYDPATLFGGAMVWNVVDDTYLKLNYTEGFRPPDFQSTSINSEAINQITFQPNPNLKVERSRAAELELNSVLLTRGQVSFIDRLYLRADYSASLLSDIIVNDSGRFRNSGTRLINSVEFLARLEFRGDHELWAAYYFVDVDDTELGKLRNIANHIVNTGTRVMILPELWEVSALMTWIGPREDRNRFIPAGRDPFLGDFIAIRPTDVFVERLDPVVLLRLGTRVLDVGGFLTLSGFVYNALDQRWQDPDLFFDDRTSTRPYPKGRWSFFMQAEASF